MVFQAGDRQRVEVSTNLDERAGATLVEGVVVPRTRHASTRFVAIEPEDDPLRFDIWTPLLVTARLRRLPEIERRLPSPRPRGYKSCMPEIVPEPWKDQPAEERPQRLLSSEISLFDRMSAYALRLSQSDATLAKGWASRDNDARTARLLRTSVYFVRKWRQALLRRMAADWNAAGWPIEDEDITTAETIIHREVDSTV